MKKIILFLGCLLPYFVSNAQTTTTDSLRKLVQNSPDDTSRVLNLAKLSRTYLYSKPDSGMILARQVLSDARRLNYATGEIVGLNMLGNLFSVTGNYPRALELFLEALKKAEAAGDEENISRLLTGIGINYSYLDDQRTSVDYTLRALAIAEKNNYPIRIVTNLINAGDGYEKLGILDSARLLTTRAYDEAMKMKDDDLISIALNNLGNISAKSNQDEVAMGYYRFAMPYLEKVGNDETICENYMGRSRIFKKSNNPDSCLYFAKQAFQIAKSAGFTSQMMNASTFLTDYYVDAHNTDSAFVYQQATLNAKESQFNSEKNRELQNLAFEEMMRQQKLEEARLETALQRRNNLQYGAIGIFLVIFATVFLLLSRSFVVNERWVRFLGVLGLLLVFEFINLLLHPRIADITHHSPVATLLLMVIIAAVLIPLHHRLEHNVINRMVEKNKRIRLETAKKIVEQLGGEQSR